MSEKKKSNPSELFTLRLWLEELGNGQQEWRGKIQHVLSGKVRYFRGLEGLTDKLEGLLESRLTQERGSESDRGKKEKG